LISIINVTDQLWCFTDRGRDRGSGRRDPPSPGRNPREDQPG